MGELTGFTQSYLAPAPDSPWMWSDGGQVLCWSTGATIAFLPEVRAALARVAREAEVVPPFTAVALLLYALRQVPRGTLPMECVGWIRAQLMGGGASPRTRIVALTGFEQLERGLGVLARIPAEFWARPDAKELVAVAVFEAGSVRRDPSQAALLARALEHGLPPWSFAPRPEVASRLVEAWSEAFSILLHGLARFEPDALLLRARTSLESLPAAAELAIESRGGARELIDELREDLELASVAALARRLLATMYLPRPIVAREDLPIGGVSDISNRGSLERLLASELAHDDLTLAVRIALNEALYTRRESPPRPRTGARCVLIDTGIRMWGLPRVFAAAVALALAASAERSRPVLLWRTGAVGLEPVDLTRREGLVSLLAALDSAPHPGASVERFLDEVLVAGEGSEAFLVSHERALSDPGFRAAARQLGAAATHAILVDGVGHLRVEAHSARGARVVHEAELDLSALLAAPKRPARSAPLPELEVPAFLRLMPSPLLLPHDLQRSWFASAPGGAVVAWTPDHELALWVQKGLCARILARHTGPNRVWLFECTEEGVVHLVKSDERRRIVWHRYDLGSGQDSASEVVDEPRGLLAATRIGADLVLAGHRDAWLVEGASSSGQARATHLSATWLGGRYFRTPEHPLAMLRLTPAGPRFEPLECARPDAAREVRCVFERTGASGPWAIAWSQRELQAFALGGDELVKLRPAPPLENVRFTRSSPDGWRVLDHTGRWLLDLQRGFVVEDEPHVLLSALRGKGDDPVRSVQVRNRIRALGVARGGQLVLVDRSGKTLAFLLRSANGTGVIDLAESSTGDVLRRVPFERAQMGDGRITKVATSARGDRAFLDRRGLLHLVPAERRRPQMTVLLPHERAVGIWCADGRVHGPECFVGTQPRLAGGEEMISLLCDFAEGFA